MDDLMVDLETMGKSTDAAIVAVGAVFMDRARLCLGPEFYRVVDLGTAVRAGGRMDPDTVKWWLGQGDQARDALRRDRHPLERVLLELHTWMQLTAAAAELRVWGNGAAFDCVILRGAYERLDLPVPWHWANDRCYRTLKREHPEVSEPPNQRVKHHALADARQQAAHLLQIWRATAQAPAVEASHG